MASKLSTTSVKENHKCAACSFVGKVFCTSATKGKYYCPQCLGLVVVKPNKANSAKGIKGRKASPWNRMTRP